MLPTMNQVLKRQMSLMLVLLLWAVVLATHSTTSAFYTTMSPPTRRSRAGAPPSFFVPRKQQMVLNRNSSPSTRLPKMARTGGDDSPVDRPLLQRAATTKMTSTVKRRAILAKLLLTATTTTAVLTAKATMSPKPSSPWMSSSSSSASSTFTASTADTTGTSSPIIQRLDSLEEALDMIATSCDKRFLHAVVASDYKLLYRGVDADDSRRMITIRREPYDLLDPTTYGSKEAVQYFTRLEQEQLKDRPLQPSNSHLATTSVTTAKAWGGAAVSIWPLQEDNNDSVHFAWKERGGLFWPSSDTAGTQQELYSAIIVDGVDCGKQSLDDVLQQDNSEVMFRANRFLAVPSSMDDQLIAKLKGAFLI
jgi:hypothetical protein